MSIAWLIETVMYVTEPGVWGQIEIGSRYRTVHYTEMSFSDIISKDIATDGIINRYFKYMTKLATSLHY